MGGARLIILLYSCMVQDVPVSQVVSPGFSPSHLKHAASEVGGAHTLLSISFMSDRSQHSDSHPQQHGQLDETLQSEV